MKNNHLTHGQNKATPSIPLIRGKLNPSLSREVRGQVQETPHSRGKLNPPLIRGVRGVLNILQFINKFFLRVCFGFLILFVPQILEAASEETSVAQTETSKKIYTVIEFESTFMNRRKEEVLKILGEPDKKSQVQGREAWKYSQIVKDVGKVWDQNVMFDFGRVNYVWIDNGK